MVQQWDSKLYDNQHNFVTKYGEDVLLMLEAKPGERILDLGCGTGVLTNEIHKICRHALGIDSSENMINEARAKFPDVEFQIVNAYDFKFEGEFDAVFSNAALHWMTKPEEVIKNIWNSLKPGGRFVFEMGGQGNLQKILQTVTDALTGLKLPGFLGDNVNMINYFPSLGTYSTLLENQGFRVEFAQIIDRPTQLTGKDGLREWVRMFRNNALQQIPANRLDDFFELLEMLGRPSLYKDGTWIADYVRLRAIAKKPGCLTD